MRALKTSLVLLLLTAPAIPQIVSGGQTNLAIQSASTTTLGGDVAITANTLTPIITKAVTMPTTGCPCRAMVAYGMNLTSTSSETISADVSDGTNRMAGSQMLLTGSATSAGVSGAAVSPVTYANGAAVTFTLEIQDNNNGMTVKAAPNVAGFQNSWLNINIVQSN